VEHCSVHSEGNCFAFKRSNYDPRVTDEFNDVCCVFPLVTALSSLNNKSRETFDFTLSWDSQAVGHETEKRFVASKPLLLSFASYDFLIVLTQCSLNFLHLKSTSKFVLRC